MRYEKTGAGNAPVPVLILCDSGYSGIFHNNCFDGVSNMLAGIRTFLQLRVDLTPCDYVKQILIVKLFPAVIGRFQIKLVAFLFGGLSGVVMGALSQRYGVRGFEIGFAVMGAAYVLGAAAVSVSFFFTFFRDRIVEAPDGQP